MDYDPEVVAANSIWLISIVLKKVLGAVAIFMYHKYFLDHVDKAYDHYDWMLEKLDMETMPLTHYVQCVVSFFLIVYLCLVMVTIPYMMASNYM